MWFRNCYEPYAFVCVKINNEELLFYFWIGLVVARSTVNLHSKNNKRMSFRTGYPGGSSSLAGVSSSVSASLRRSSLSCTV